MLDHLPEDLHVLRRSFQARQKDIRSVGGAVRDRLLGLIPKDEDFCTNASIPEMQIIGISSPAVLEVLPTGIDHGTLTFRLKSGFYEITCLREETNHDGRRADCTFGTDWEKDLSRRDLTINAMAMDFDGKLYDPFGGAEDLAAGRVRFVGEATDRMKEDYLRILRWLRFHGRFSTGPLDFQAVLAAQDVREGLSAFHPGTENYIVSRERIWAEMAKIVSGPRAGYLMHYLVHMHLDKHIGMQGAYNINEFDRVAALEADPIVRLVAFHRTVEQITDLATAWKWSNEERAHATFLAKETHGHRTRLDWLLLMDTAPKDWVLQVAHLRNDHAAHEELTFWDVPVFPVRGKDLIELGFKPGPQFGYILDTLRTAWAHEKGQISKEALLAGIEPGVTFE